jgi:hypothetical protein
MMAASVVTFAPSAAAVAPECTSSTPTFIGGSIYGYPDNNAINALIGFDLKAGTTTVNPDGTVRTAGGYGFSQTVNPTLPATGAAVGSKTWGLCVASNITQVFLEIYPRNPLGQTDRTRYGGASHYRQPITSGADNQILLRLPVRYEAGSDTTGYVNGYITYAGHRVDPTKITRVRAFSTGSGPDCGVEGFQADADELAYSGTLDATYYRLDALAGQRCGAASQQYQVTIECTDVCGQAGPRSLQQFVDIVDGALNGKRVDFAF